MARRRNLDGLTRRVLTELGREVYAIADVVRVEAQVSITRGAVSGKGHVASSPGEAPNNDTGDLAGGIKVEPLTPLSARVVSNALHSVPLEFGTSKMASRPFMAPAVEATRKQVRKMTAQAVNRAVRKFAKGQ